MDLSNSIISFIDTLGVVQGLLFGVVLIFYYSKKNKPILFLGMFILLFSLEPIPNILHDLNYLTKHPELELLPVGFHFLAYPLLLIYVQKTSILKEKKANYWTLIPGVIEFLVALVIFLLPYQLKLQIKNSSAAIVYFIGGLSYSLYIAYLILKWIHSHVIEVHNQYTYVQRKTLSWTKWFTYASVLFHLVILINIFLESHAWYAWISVLNVILIYWVSFKGVTQENIRTLVWNKNVADEQHPIDHSTKTKLTPLLVSSDKITSQTTQNLMSINEAQQTCIKVDDYIQVSKCYMNNKLTIIDIAEAIHVHPKRISYAINKVKSQNFNSYINSFRVELAKKLLKSNEAQHLSIEGIGLEAGFHTKATFYNAFKKNVHMTPAQYKSSL
ncbi:helix-turn-helix domain-containing protein [Tenacibaculum sp. 190130A14a]|uniref:HTH araC/xylS-type domain-containing protein n=1 Tax=Tenacibaculum polynesiense TaxID=3137857 RepID=A0ABP1ET32_9FLAO